MTIRFSRIDKTFFTFRHVHKSSSTISFAKGCLTKPLDLSIRSHAAIDDLHNYALILWKWKCACCIDNKTHTMLIDRIRWLSLIYNVYLFEKPKNDHYFSVVYTLNVSVFFSSENSYSLKL